MSRISILAATLALGAAATTPAVAEISESTFRSGRAGDLATLCATSETAAGGVAARAWCNAFIIATGQYHNAIAAASPQVERVYCLPDPNMTLDQVRTAFVGWSRSHPEYANERAVDGLMRFAGTTWPCPRPLASDRRR